jgi:SNF2 family DNA or RNA helicase
MRFVPHEYQKKAIAFIEEHPAAGLFLDMGLGKTVITLTAIQDLIYDSCEVSRVLVIAPLRVAEDTWSREASKWDHLKDLRISKVLGAAADRKKALLEDSDVYITNRENVSWLVLRYLQAKKKWPFDMIVIDELSSFKSSQSQRFKALRKVRAVTDRIVGLTGTPAGNSLMDLWAEMYLLDRGERLGPTLTSYRSNYFRPGYGNGVVVYKWEPQRGAMQEITKRIGDITMSMTAGDYIDLPDQIDSTVEISLSDKAMTAYKDMEREALLKIDDSEITALNAASLTSKLLQISNGFIYDEDHNVTRIHTEKTEALDEIIEAADSPVIVFYSFIADRDHLLEHYKGRARVLDTDKDIERWNAGKIEILLAHPASVGYGLNLQDGGHIIVWYGLTWSLEQYEQANARLHRQGQKKPVLVYQLIAKGTADEDVSASLKRKDTTQSTLIGILKDRREAYEEDKR